MFSNSFAGIAPSSVPAFSAAQVIGGIAGALIIKALYSGVTPAGAGDVVVPHGAAGIATAASDGAAPAAHGSGRNSR